MRSVAVTWLRLCALWASRRSIASRAPACPITLTRWLPDPAAEARRQRVLELLAANRGARYALVTDLETDPKAVLLALAIRGKASCELRIPREKYDSFLLLALIERHCG